MHSTFHGNEIIIATDDKGRDRQAAELVEPYVNAGITWWVEPVDPWRFGWSFEVPWSPEAALLMRERVRQGSPRLG